LSFGSDEDAIEQMVAKRMERQRVLYEHGKQVQVVMLEGALRTRVVSAPTLLDNTPVAVRQTTRSALSCRRTRVTGSPP